MTKTEADQQPNAGADQGGGGTGPKTDERAGELQLPGKPYADPENPPTDPPPKTDERSQDLLVPGGPAASPEDDPPDTEPKTGRSEEVRTL